MKHIVLILIPCMTVCFGNYKTNTVECEIKTICDGLTGKWSSEATESFMAYPDGKYTLRKATHVNGQYVGDFVYEKPGMIAKAGKWYVEQSFDGILREHVYALHLKFTRDKKSLKIICPLSDDKFILQEAAQKEYLWEKDQEA